MKSSNLLIFLLVLVVSGCGGGGGGVFVPPALVTIAVTPAAPSVARGTTQQFAATGKYANNSTQDLTASVTWTSTNNGVATISATGLATPVAAGQTTIRATLGSISGETIMTVTTATLVSIAVTPDNPIVAIGASPQFTATGSFTGSTTQNLTTQVFWSSSAPSVATISNAAGSNGRATAVAAGTTRIKSLFGNISGSTSLTVPGGAAANVLPVTVNGSLCSAGSYPNKPCVSVTVCTPGTATCQTINDILLDTGSYGLRIFKQVLTTVTLNQVTVPSGNLAECVKFVDGTADWGPVQSAGVILGGEPAVTVPVQVIDATFGTVPTSCGTPLATPAAAGFNGILGVGLFAQDCGTGCVTGVNNGVYFACTGATCSPSTVPLASQVQNPVALLPVNNNGVLVQLPVVPAGGAQSINGQLVLGIGTQANNGPSGVVAYPANPFTGDFITVFNGITYGDPNSSSFIDTGSNGLFFNDPGLPACAPPNAAWFCPPATTNLSAVTEGFTGMPSVTVPFQIGNAIGLFNSGNRVFAELGGQFSGIFDWGLPFFYGRNVFVGIQGRNSSLGAGPLWAY